MDQVGRYQILEELGRGAHGVVYKALDPAIGRTIAIKAIALDNINIADRERVRAGILREARLAGTLSHPNVVTVYDVLDSGASAYIFMEFVDGKSLEKAIAETKDRDAGRLTRGRFLSILKQVAQGLDYAHRKGVIHRDIKPANVVLTNPRGEEGEVLAKIADFGVAKFASHDVTQPLSGRPMAVGTPNYMSPEQVQGAAVSGASDQFSLAGIAYEVLCSKRPFAADTVDAVLYRIRHEEAEPAHVANKALSTTVTKVLERALRKNPNERFGSCGEFVGALEFAVGDSARWQPGYAGMAPEQLSPEEARYEIDAPEERTWGKTLALIVGLCLAVGLAMFMIVRMNSGPVIATQVLDTRSGAVSPPPTVEELKYDKHAAAPTLELSAVQAKTVPAAQPTATPVSRRAADNSPTVVEVPVPDTKVARKTPVAEARTVKQVASSGEVRLLTDPVGANVTVDGTSTCITPCSLTLAAGRHTLAANLEGYGVSRKIFYVPADTSLLVSLTKSMGVLLVTSEPVGASVNVDGRTVGTTPLTLRLPAGPHRVAVWDGTRWREESIQVSSDDVRTRLFRF